MGKLCDVTADLVRAGAVHIVHSVEHRLKTPSMLDTATAFDDGDLPHLGICLHSRSLEFFKKINPSDKSGSFY